MCACVTCAQVGCEGLGSNRLGVERIAKRLLRRRRRRPSDAVQFRPSKGAERANKEKGQGKKNKKQDVHWLREIGLGRAGGKIELSTLMRLVLLGMAYRAKD